jgi:hypothetical protein
MSEMTICGQITTRRRVARHVRSFFIDPSGELWVSVELVPGGPLAAMIIGPAIRWYGVGKKRYPYIQASVLRREYPDHRELIRLLNRMAGAVPADLPSNGTNGE